MTLERLKELLEKGSITQEEYDVMAEKLKASDSDKKPDTLDDDKIDRLFQAKFDKAMAEERKEKAELKKQVKELQKIKLSDDELKELKQQELEEKENAILEREKEIADKENRLFAVKALKEAGLDDGSDTSLAIIEFVMDENPDKIKSKIKAFKTVFDKAVNAEVTKRFKENGRTPNSSNDGEASENPYLKDSFNLTRQMLLEQNNPELAAKYKAAAKLK